MITLLTLLVVPAALTVLYHVLNLSFYLKLWLKMDIREEVKPLDCLFCMGFWFYFIMSLAIIWLNPQFWLFYMAAGTVISHLLDKIN